MQITYTRLISTSLLATVLFCHTSHLLANDDPAIEVEIIKFKFQPREITIKVGDTVRWTNKEKRQYHSVWFEQAGDPEPDYIFPDETYQRTFGIPGTFPYRCGPHPKMTGSVTVE
ncbi:MAG: cupredoxin domain-containing protein [Candidatus Sedimenticola sp. (ex Thyasira tokunagai)]